jgi:hypothetical protein
MFCSISGQAPERAVVSKPTSHVYEASLLEKYLVAEGKVRGGNPATPAASAPLEPIPIKNTPPPPTSVSLAALHQPRCRRMHHHATVVWPKHTI